MLNDDDNIDKVPEQSEYSLALLQRMLSPKNQQLFPQERFVESGLICPQEAVEDFDLSAIEKKDDITKNKFDEKEMGNSFLGDVEDMNDLFGKEQDKPQSRQNLVDILNNNIANIMSSAEGRVPGNSIAQETMVERNLVLE